MAGNHRERELKTVALDSRSAVAERRGFKRAPTTVRVESTAADAGEESWTGASGTVDCGAAWRAGMKLLDNSVIVLIQNEQ